MLEHYRDLAEQLAAMPGGHARLREEYFGSITLACTPTACSSCNDTVVETWALKAEGALALINTLNDDAQLVWLRESGEEAIAVFTGGLCAAAREYAISPLGLALLVLAMGSVDDGRLKKLLPDLHKASKGLLLIAACRLCG